MSLYLGIFFGAFGAGFVVGLIARIASSVKCTAIRELPDYPITMEHTHGGEEDE